MAIEFVINSNTEYFEKWFSDYHSRHSPGLMELEPDEKWMAVLDGPFRSSKPHWGYVMLEIQALTQTWIDEKSVQASHEFVVIRFKLLPLSESRLKIEANWKHNRLQSYFERILLEIAKLWPEAKTQIYQSLDDEGIRLGDGYSQEICVPLHELDVSVSRWIEKYSVKLATAERDEIIPGGRVIYRLSWWEFGRIGEVELRRFDQKVTWLAVSYVQPIDKESRENIKKHMDLVIRALRSGLAEDDIWEKHEKEVERREEASAPEHKQPGWELAQQFNFTADAADICAYIMGGENWREANYREIDVTDGQFVMRAVLSAEPGLNALYSIAILAGTQDGTEFTYDEGENWLLSPSTDVGEIALVQEGLGNCTVQLYVEMNPRKLGSDHTSLWRITPSLVTLLWHQLIEEWRKRSSTTSEKTERADVKPDNEASIHGAGEDAQQEKPAMKSKRGPRPYSVEEKLKALDDWDRLDRDIYPILLEDWLVEQFGSENGVANVKPSTFHGWRKLRKEK